MAKARKANLSWTIGSRTSFGASWGAWTSFILRLLAGVSMGEQRSRLMQAEAELAKEPLALAYAERDAVLLVQEVRKSLAFPRPVNPKWLGDLRTASATEASCSSVNRRGPPGRSPSTRPASPCCSNRWTKFSTSAANRPEPGLPTEARGAGCRTFLLRSADFILEHEGYRPRIGDLQASHAGTLHQVGMIAITYDAAYIGYGGSACDSQGKFRRRLIVEEVEQPRAP